MSPRSCWPLLPLLALGVAGCADSPSEPGLDPAPRLSAHGGAKRVVHRVTGSGHTTAGQSTKRVFSFSAVERADGSVSGQFTLMISAPILGSENPSITRLHAEVVCVSVQANRAWVGGVVKNASNPAWVGGETGWAVEDNGEGRSASDRISLMFVPVQAPGFAQSVCDDRTQNPTIPVEGGNVQVR